MLCLLVSLWPERGLVDDRHFGYGSSGSWMVRE